MATAKISDGRSDIPGDINDEARAERRPSHAKALQRVPVRTDALAWARVCAAGDYLVEYDDVPKLAQRKARGEPIDDNRCDLSDDDITAVREVLNTRGMAFWGDERGLYARLR
jgi:hypothetical protein